MIDPAKITNFNRTIPELQELLIFSIMVANKPANITANKLEQFLQSADGKTPFDKVTNLWHDGKLSKQLRKFKFGQYKRIFYALKGVLTLDVKSCTVQELEAVYGIGPKTARLFLLHSRPNQQLAVLDTHILKYLQSLGYNINQKSLTKKRYIEYEQILLNHIVSTTNKSFAEFDLDVWNFYTKGESNGSQPVL